MQLRDYPHPLLDITEITITGRMMFAEQEAQQRGTCMGVPSLVGCGLFCRVLVEQCVYVWELWCVEWDTSKPHPWLGVALFHYVLVGCIDVQLCVSRVVIWFEGEDAQSNSFFTACDSIGMSFIARPIPSFPMLHAEILLATLNSCRWAWRHSWSCDVYK